MKCILFKPKAKKMLYVLLFTLPFEAYFTGCISNKKIKPKDQFLAGSESKKLWQMNSITGMVFMRNKAYGF